MVVATVLQNGSNGGMDCINGAMVLGNDVFGSRVLGNTLVVTIVVMTCN